MAWSLMERMSPDDLAKLRASLPPGDNQTAANIARSVDPNDPTMAGFGIEHPADVEAPGPPPPDKGPSLDDLNRALTDAAHARAAAHAIAAWQRTNPEARPDEEKIAEGLSAPLQGVLARQRFVGEQGKQATGEMERQHLGALTGQERERANLLVEQAKERREQITAGSPFNRSEAKATNELITQFGAKPIDENTYVHERLGSILKAAENLSMQQGRHEEFLARVAEAHAQHAFANAMAGRVQGEKERHNLAAESTAEERAQTQKEAIGAKKEAVAGGKVTGIIERSADQAASGYQLAERLKQLYANLGGPKGDALTYEKERTALIPMLAAGESGTGQPTKPLLDKFEKLIPNSPSGLVDTRFKTAGLNAFEAARASMKMKHQEYTQGLPPEHKLSQQHQRVFGEAAISPQQRPPPQQQGGQAGLNTKPPDVMNRAMPPTREVKGKTYYLTPRGTYTDTPPNG